MTLDKAVGLLAQDNEDTLIYAASHIQNQCFKTANAKKMVCLLICSVGSLVYNYPIFKPQFWEEVPVASFSPCISLFVQIDVRWQETHTQT